MLDKDLLHLLTNDPSYIRHISSIQEFVEPHLRDTANQWLEIIPELLRNERLTLKLTNSWRDALTEKPKVPDPENCYAYSTSEKVLIKTKNEEVMCAYYQQDEDFNEKWISACSEGWDITSHVTNWKFIDYD